MNEDKMSEKTSDFNNEIPKVFAENSHRYPEWVFELRRKLYCKAKQEPKYQFYTLYSLICRQEVMEAAWGLVSRNKGAPGVDGVSIAEIQSAPNGVEQFLTQLRQDLLNKTYQPSLKRLFLVLHMHFLSSRGRRPRRSRT